MCLNVAIQGIGSGAGMLEARPSTRLIWVVSTEGWLQSGLTLVQDAHADLNTQETSTSGNIHGMAVSFLMGLHDCFKVPGFEWMEQLPKLDPSRIVYVGLRDVDPKEQALC